jgi:hypothetical protein
VRLLFYANSHPNSDYEPGEVPSTSNGDNFRAFSQEVMSRSLPLVSPYLKDGAYQAFLVRAWRTLMDKTPELDESQELNQIPELDKTLELDQTPELDERPELDNTLELDNTPELDTTPQLDKTPGLGKPELVAMANRFALSYGCKDPPRVPSWMVEHMQLDGVPGLRIRRENPAGRLPVEDVGDEHLDPETLESPEDLPEDESVPGAA